MEWIYWSVVITTLLYLAVVVINFLVVVYGKVKK